jgi:hypothetical protein
MSRGEAALGPGLDGPWRTFEALPMRIIGPMLLLAAAGIGWVGFAWADQEASNLAHVAAGPYGRCYAKSVPEHIYDPENGPRQSGRTVVYRVEPEQDVLLQRFDWFSQKLFLNCGAGKEFSLARLGPWHRGHEPRHDHLAIAFYKNGRLLKRYSTLDIARLSSPGDAGRSGAEGISVSVSHYSVFESGLEMVRIVKQDGPVFSESWVVSATTVDGDELAFSMISGELISR